MTYDGTDANDDGVVEAGVDNESVSTDKIKNVADHIVSSTSELESAFNNLSAGETIWVGTPDTPYRPSQWLDIDVSGVTVIGQSTHAADGSALIKTADNADVGGIRVGFNSSVSDIRILNVGHDGNANNQDSTVKRLHNFIFHNATDSEIRSCFATRPSPYREHNSGGSSISVRHQCQRIRVVGNYIDDTGDRCIQSGGTGVIVYGNECINGYDRAVSTDIEEPDGNLYASEQMVVANNYARDMTDGSAYSAVGGTASGHTDARNITIRGNIAEGDFKKLVTTDARSGVVENVAIVGNVGYPSVDDTAGIPIAQSVNYVTIVGNVLDGFGGDGINISGKHYLVANNIIRGAGRHGIRVFGDFGQLVANRVQASDDNGFHFGTCSNVVTTGNFVQTSDQNANGSDEVYIDSGAADIRMWGDHIDQTPTNNQYNDSGTRTLINGFGQESANAEEPSEFWPAGATVDFTDSGDGSGTGVYRKYTSNSWIQLA